MEGQDSLTSQRQRHEFSLVWPNTPELKDFPKKLNGWPAGKLAGPYEQSVDITGAVGTVGIWIQLSPR